jgi:hypothetical protein
MNACYTWKVHACGFHFLAPPVFARIGGIEIETLSALLGKQKDWKTSRLVVSSLLTRKVRFAFSSSEITPLEGADTSF